MGARERGPDVVQGRQEERRDAERSVTAVASPRGALPTALTQRHRRHGKRQVVSPPDQYLRSQVIQKCIQAMSAIGPGPTPDEVISQRSQYWSVNTRLAQCDLVTPSRAIRTVENIQKSIPNALPRVIRAVGMDVKIRL